MKIYVATFEAHFADFTDNRIYEKVITLRSAFTDEHEAWGWSHNDIQRMIEAERKARLGVVVGELVMEYAKHGMEEMNLYSVNPDREEE